MRVLHVNNISNVPGAYALGLRKLGVEVVVEHYYAQTYDFPADLHLHLERYAWPKRLWKRWQNFVWAVRNFDIVHMHSSALLPFYLDAPLSKLVPGAKAKLVYSHWGSDLRGKRVPFFSTLNCAKRYVCPDLCEEAPDASVLFVAVDADEWKPTRKRVGPRQTRKVVVMHAPTNRAFKNTPAVLAAVAELRRRGVPFEFRLIENLPISKLRTVLAECDILVDQLNFWYATLACEALSMNKVVLAKLKPEWRRRFVPDAPIVQVTPGTLADELERLINNKARRESIARHGRPFVLKHHDARVVARQLKTDYEAILRKR